MVLQDPIVLLEFLPQDFPNLNTEPLFVDLHYQFGATEEGMEPKPSAESSELQLLEISLHRSTANFRVSLKVVRD